MKTQTAVPRIVCTVISAIVAVLLLVLTLTCPVLWANSEANLGGQVTSKEVYYGPQGSISTIELMIDTMDGLQWVAVCRRSNTSLGWCAQAESGQQVQVKGTISGGYNSIEVQYLGVKF